MKVEPEVDKSDAEDITQVIFSLIPHKEKRKLCLEMLVESINHANCFGSDKWGTYYDTGKIRLLVGSLIVFTIEKERIWLSLDKSFLEASEKFQRFLDVTDSWQWDEHDYPAYTQVLSKNGYYVPSKNYEESWSVIKQLHFEFINKVAAKYKRLKKISQAKHSSVLLAYIRSEVNKFVSDPIYEQFEQPEVHAKHQRIEFSRYFNTETLVDTRRRVNAFIVQRQGQADFRRKLLNAYGGRCPITDCDAEPAIEAAHIIPYRSVETNHPTNGLPLRADVHNLFDLYLLSIRPDNYQVVIAPELTATCYQKLAGRRLTLPLNELALPDKVVLTEHYKIFLQKQANSQ